MNYSLGYDEMKLGTQLDGKPVEYDFKVSSGQGGYRSMPTVKEVFNQYPGVKIKLVGVDDLKHKLVETESGTRPMTTEDVKNVLKLADRVRGFLSKEEWKDRINQLDTEGLFEED